MAIDILETLLRAPPFSSGTRFERAIDRALAGGFAADRLGYAFASGYEAALEQLFGFAAATLDLPRSVWPEPGTRLSLAATEAGGGHPRAIATVLESNVVSGVKTFATLASKAEELLVVVTIPTTEPRPSLRLVRVRADAPGVTIDERPPTPFAPEIPHARVTFANVAVTAVLPGDGYDIYLKPFRTIEDTHVLGATLGHVIGAARAFGFDRAIVERAIGAIVAVREIAARSPSDPTTHIVLSGLFAGARHLIADTHDEWAKSDPATRERWQRDLPLLLVAETVRQKRTEAAWTALSGS